MGLTDTSRRASVPRPSSRGWRCAAVGIGSLAILLLAGAGQAADPPPTAKDVRERIDAAAKQLDADQPAAAASTLGEAIGLLEALAAAPRTAPAVKTLSDRATSVRRRLEKAGVDVTRLVVPGPARAAPAAPPPGKPPVVGKTAGVSFSRQVAPLLARSCGGCHIAGKKGGFQMASYDGLMQSGMVQRGQGQASRLVDVILTGDMPRGGGKVSSAEVATLVAWIDAGAPFDGVNPLLGIDLVARGGGAPAPPAAAAAIRPVAIKPGDVSFATDVAPLLQEHCLKCHGGDETEANLSMATFEALLKGGRTPTAIVAGKGAESLLVKKLRGAGIEGQRMPLGGPPLPDPQIALIARWIDEGARLDMLTSRAPLDAVVAAGQAKKLSDAELAAKRFAAGEKLWRRAIPDEQPLVQPRSGVCVIGNLPADRLAEVADAAEGVAANVRREFDITGPLLKGGVVIFALQQAVDYSAFWQVLANAERPKGLSGHAGVSGDVVYGALLVPANETPDDLRAGLADVITAAAFAGRATPGWFSQGAGRVAAARLAGKSDLAQQWRREAAGSASRLGSAADFLAGHADPATLALAGGGLLGTLASGGRLGQLAAALDGGATFDEAFAHVFRVTPAQAFEKWAARAAR